MRNVIITLYGPDSYRRQKKIRELIEAYRSKNQSSAHEHFDLAEDRAKEKLIAFIKNQPLFSKNRLIVIENASEADKEIKAVFKDLIHDDSITAIFSSDKKPLKEYEFLIKSPAKSQSFEPHSGTELIAFLKNEAVSRSLKISDAEIRQVASFYGDDIWAMVAEIEKVSLGGSFETPYKNQAFFPLIMKLKSKLPVQTRLGALAHLLQNEDPGAIFNVTASVADLPLKQKMADYDALIKSGKLDYEEALLDLALN